VQFDAIGVNILIELMFDLLKNFIK